MPPRDPSTPYDRLPRFPAPLVRVLRHIEDPDISSDGLQSMVGRDPGLIESLIEAANHPFFAQRAPIRSLAQAIACMGRGGFHDLLFTAAALWLFREGLAALDWTALRAHALACGLLSRELARRFRIVEPGAAYRAGLVHDIGFLALGAGPREASARAVKKAEREALPLWVVEGSVLGTDHGRCGFSYGERLDLPRALLLAVRFHHQPAEAPPPRALPALVGFADVLARASGLGYGFPEDLGTPGGLANQPSWRVLCEERPALHDEDPAAVYKDMVERLGNVPEAARELFTEAVLDSELAR